MGETFDQIEKQYFSVKGRFNDLIAACKTDEQRAALQAAYASLRDNYNKAMNQRFEDNDPAIATLRSELQRGQEEIERSLTNLKDITAVIDSISSAVSIGTKLVEIVGGA
jgi:chromosome segregation ATPase